MGDQWQKSGDDAEDGERDVLLHGSPEEKIKTWLKLTVENDGHYKSGVSSLYCFHHRISD